MKGFGGITLSALLAFVLIPQSVVDGQDADLLTLLGTTVLGNVGIIGHILQNFINFLVTTLAWTAIWIAVGGAFDVTVVPAPAPAPAPADFLRNAYSSGYDTAGGYDPDPYANAHPATGRKADDIVKRIGEGIMPVLGGFEQLWTA